MMHLRYDLLGRLSLGEKQKKKQNPLWPDSQCLCRFMSKECSVDICLFLKIERPVEIV